MPGKKKVPVILFNLNWHEKRKISYLVLDVCVLWMPGHAAALLGWKYVGDEGVLAPVEPAHGAAQAQQDGHGRGAERQPVVLREGPLLALALLHHTHESFQQLDLGSIFDGPWYIR